MNALPHAGLAFGHYPEAPRRPRHEAWVHAGRWLRALLQPSPRRPAGLPAPLRAALQAAEAEAGARLAGAAEAAAALAPLAAQARQRLQREGLAEAAVGQALGLASAAATRVLGLSPYPTQQLGAWLMLDGRLAEMATGEGKTLAMGLAAAVSGLAGVPVHVLTANDYLAQRDEAQLAPLYRALGLGSACVVAATPPAERAARYGHAIVHATAREIGFDYLRDHLRLQGRRDPRLARAQALGGQAVAPPVLPGLCFALLDEADSTLLDEAGVPLLLAAPDRPLDPERLQQAWALAGRLRPGAHFELHAATRRAWLLQPGQDAVAAAAAGPVARQWLEDLVQTALAARWLHERGRDYVLHQGDIALVDAATGRIAEGRRWSGALHALVQLKEGLPPAPPTRTAAQITYPELLARYQRLGGLSGTLAGAAAELQALYGLPVARVPLARPSQRRWQGLRVYARAAQAAQAVQQAVQAAQAAGRPVLVGTDSVATAAALSQRLQAAGVPHQRLDALQDADEAACVARAGQAGCVTVATNRAGRGTDIRLDAAARAAGGLHVVAAALNRSRRIDRQLVGRGARHGDPGSAEAVLSLDDPLLVQAWPRALRRLLAATARHDGRLPWPAAALLLRGTQARLEWADALLRWQLAHAARERGPRLGFAGPAE